MSSSLGSNFSKRLREYRRKRDLNQTELANKLGVARATIGRWESEGGPAVTLEQVELLAKHLKISPAELMGFVELGTDNIVVNRVSYWAYKEAFDREYPIEPEYSGHTKLTWSAAEKPLLPKPHALDDCLEAISKAIKQKETGEKR